MNVIDIPGYLEAVLQEKLVRDASILRLRESVNGFECLPMTLRHFLILRLAESPFLKPFRVPSELDLANFLWVVSPWYPDMSRRPLFFQCCRDFFPPKKKWWESHSSFQVRRIRNFDRFTKTSTCAQGYVTEAFQDEPGGVQGNITGFGHYSDIVSAVAILSREFGWSIEYVLDLSLKITFQFLKENREHFMATIGQNAMLGSRSDRIKSDFLASRNRANGTPQPQN